MEDFFQLRWGVGFVGFLLARKIEVNVFDGIAGFDGDWVIEWQIKRRLRIFVEIDSGWVIEAVFFADVIEIFFIFEAIFQFEIDVWNNEAFREGSLCVQSNSV